ncbi:MAG: hypothetical protein EAZ95_05415 [Bacteroidetes bacterium]|nr:MAG: hypothetical protein EAZ95_05415 [Bacteroidota bacterium]
MFLNLLKQEEKIAFLTLAKKIISIDSTISKQEMVLLNSMKRELELDDIDVQYLDASIEEVCALFSNSKSKVSAIMELIGIGFVDGKFVLEEQNLIYQIADAMNISREETNMYIDWARRVYVR